MTATEAKLLTADELLRLYSRGVRGELIRGVLCERGPGGQERGRVLALNDKARMWLSHGVRLVWVVHPDTRTVDVHRMDGEVSTLAGDDALDGFDVLPGFACTVSDVFG